MTKEKELIAIIEYGAGNLFSVEAAVKRLGYTAVVSDDPAVIGSADKVIFPGVGQAKQAMNRLIACGLDRSLPELKVPVLGICLGMQLMCDYSEEGATEGLGIFPIRVKQMTGKAKIPHTGWNRITSLNSSLFQGIEDGAWVYFVHSYYLPVNEYQTAECSYQIPFCAGIRKDNFFGCQFHPEKSGAVGERIIQNFLRIK